MNPLSMKESRLEKKLGVLKVILKKETGPKESVIYAYKLKTNGDWRYIRSNGQVLSKKCSLNPQQMALALGEKYHHLGKEGEVQWAYINNHKSYSQINLSGSKEQQ